VGASAIVTSVELLHMRPRTRANAIFVSAGDRETFATHAAMHLTDEFDVVVFHYGSDAERRQRFHERATLLAAGSGSKFNALKLLFERQPELFASYQTIWVCDDDIEIRRGSAGMLSRVALLFGIPVISPAHAADGKIDNRIMQHRDGPHLFRFVNYVEMTCPMFLTRLLAQFLAQYDGSLDGWGTDLWYLNFFRSQHLPTAAILDAVVVKNPRAAEKPGGYREIARLASNEVRRAQWQSARERHRLEEWPLRNLFFVRPVEPFK
jgi:hypothetical protein